MKNYKFLIEYDGSRYYGWQRQPEQTTIQGKLESVLGVDLPEDVIEQVIAGVKAKLTADNVSDAVDTIKGLFKK